MFTRIFVEKRSAFRIEAETLLVELQHELQLKTLTTVRKIQVYDVMGIEPHLLEQAIATVFTEVVTDIQLDAESINADLKKCPSICIEALPGQFDQRADSAEAALLLLGATTDVVVKSAQVYLFNQALEATELADISKYMLNPVDSQFKDVTRELSATVETVTVQTIPSLSFFNTAIEAELIEMKNEMGLAMEVADLLHIQKYFQSEKRNPTETEIRVLDTYWSDHCRHTTFETELTTISFEKSQFRGQLQQAYTQYVELRKAVNREDKPETLMDMATIFPRYQRAMGKLADLEESDEINACSIKIEVDVDGKKEPWLLMFKNETHNHPTEIEPFGGASTCIGGAIRDPLSGRSYVYQAMRITGAGNILEPIQQTLVGKLPQQIISKGAAKGYSSYGNQIGLATTYVREFFHPGFVAKRMEVGAVIGAVPAHQVRREQPIPTDCIILLGGKTGRDGIGGATGSSKVQTKQTLQRAGSEVQKGNPIEERKIQRLFRQEQVTKLIKKSNDFGAGGVSVAIGELADGVLINLDKIPRKYDGLNGTELAISESQERMAVVVAKSDVAEFIAYAAAENILAVVVAEVTADKRLVMQWRGETIVDIKRTFLDTNGERAQVSADVIDEQINSPLAYKIPPISVRDEWIAVMHEMNHASQKGLQTLFDSSIGRTTVLQPIGGKYQLTPTEASVQKLPVEQGFTNTVSVLAHGYNPEIASWSPFHGAAYAVIEATARIIATGSDWRNIRFSFQEYFERMDKNPEKFGKPVAALLGALDAQIALGLPSIGGKDSMSGSYQNLHVPPSLLAFGVAVTSSDQIISPEFKQPNEYLYLLPMEQTEISTIDYQQLICNFDLFRKIQREQQVTAARALRDGGIAEALSVMMFGNRIGVALENVERSTVFQPQYGGFIFTTKTRLPEMSNIVYIGKTTTSYEINYKDEKIAGEIVEAAFESVLEPIYPTKHHVKTEDVKEIAQPLANPKPLVFPGKPVENPIVYIPVFPGTNCEYDTAKAFAKAGARPQIIPFKTLTAKVLEQSIQEMVHQLDKAHIFMLSGGFSAADEPDGSGKFIANILLNKSVQAAIARFIEKGGLILGICNGFQALVKAGLLPAGEFEPITLGSPTLFRNDTNQHIAHMIQTKIIHTNSPWLQKVKPKQIHTIPISHGEGKFVVTDDVLESLIKNGQIITQYVDFAGKPTMDSLHNPNGSVAAIEGIISPNGQILGKMAHSERYEHGLFQNIEGDKEQYLFESAVAYFQKK